jgi:hypothetical protein
VSTSHVSSSRFPSLLFTSFVDSSQPRDSSHFRTSRAANCHLASYFSKPLANRLQFYYPSRASSSIHTFETGIMVSGHPHETPSCSLATKLFSMVLVLLGCLRLATAVALPTNAYYEVARAPEPTEPPPAPTGPICTLVDGGPNGGTFCNIYTGDGPPLTDTNWVSTGASEFQLTRYIS